MPAEASSPADPASEKIGPAKLALSQVDNLADAFTAIPEAVLVNRARRAGRGGLCSVPAGRVPATQYDTRDGRIH